MEIKSNQRVFNGYGAQETCDMLFLAFIHPFMPASVVCKSNDIFDRLSKSLVNYRKDHHNLLFDLVHRSYLPLTSGHRPFAFLLSAHKYFLQKAVLCSRRHQIKVDQDTLNELHKLHLLTPEATYDKDGLATGKHNISVDGFFSNPAYKVTSPVPSPIDPAPKPVPLNITRGKTKFLQNYMFVFKEGIKSTTVFSPIVAQCHKSWKQLVSIKSSFIAYARVK